jgi:hypothetical protein
MTKYKNGGIRKGVANEKDGSQNITKILQSCKKMLTSLKYRAKITTSKP